MQIRKKKKLHLNSYLCTCISLPYKKGSLVRSLKKEKRKQEIIVLSVTAA